MARPHARWSWALATILAAGPAAAQDAGLKPLRFEEPRAARSLAWPLREDLWLGLGGEVRLRWEGQSAPDLDPAAGESSVALRRAYLFADLQAPRARLFAELYHAEADRRPGGPGPTDRNRLEWQNAFLEIAPDPNWRLRAGRQEMRLGSGRLVDFREGPNVRRTFDGVRIDRSAGRWTTTALALRPRRDRPGAFDDGSDAGQALWGLYLTGRDALGEGLTLETYLLGYENARARYAQGAASERRLSLGARLAAARGAWDANWEAVVQTGRYGAGEIRAWTLATETGRTFEGPFRPRLALSANVASGDRDPDDPDLQAFHALYPRGNYFSEDATLGPGNFVNLHPFLTLQLREDLELTADVNVFWRLEAEDGVYGPSGALLRAPAPGAPKYVATAYSLNLAWAINRNLDASLVYTRFEPGGFLKATGPAEPLDFGEATLRYRF